MNILVTGATGFIGRRFIEMAELQACERDIPVFCMKITLMTSVCFRGQELTELIKLFILDILWIQNIRMRRLQKEIFQA